MDNAKFSVGVEYPGVPTLDGLEEAFRNLSGAFPDAELTYVHYSAGNNPLLSVSFTYDG